jgi:hypothetical protein
MIPRKLGEMQEHIDHTRDRLQQLRVRLESVLQSEPPKKEEAENAAKPGHPVPLMQTLITMDEQIVDLKVFCERMINDLEL